jgi:mono/diheme cytochrome c family protein
MKKSLAVFVVLLACSPTSLASSRSQRERGAAIFAESGCTHCHTIRNNGGHKGPDLSGVGRRLKKAQMKNQIVNGSKLMPPFGDDLQAADIDALLAYLKTCRDKKE